jgi:hypothetical protein
LCGRRTDGRHYDEHARGYEQYVQGTPRSCGAGGKATRDIHFRCVPRKQTECGVYGADASLMQNAATELPLSVVRAVTSPVDGIFRCSIAGT